MKPCFGYIRVSTHKQGEGVSLEAQKDAITAFAVRNNLNIIEWFEEKETAAKSGRPIFMRMLKLLERGKAEGLVIHKIDRSARNLKDWSVIGDLSDAGVDVYFATESLDFRSRGGRLTADIQAVIAADFIRNLREETKKGMDGRLKQGLYPFHAPIGYLNNGGGKPKTICPIRGPLVKQAFQLYGTGQYSLRSLHTELNRRGLTNSAGGLLTLHGVETILRNSFYCGIIAIRRTGQTYNGVHEPLIDTATFRQVQNIKAGRTVKKTTRHNHLYHGLFRCGHCAGPLTAELQKGRVYYRCHTPTCPTTTIREDHLAFEVERVLEQVVLSDEDGLELERQWQDWIGNSERSNLLKSLDLRADQANIRMERLIDLLLDSAITQDDFNRRKRSLTFDLCRIEEERAAINQNELSAAEMQKYLELMKSLVSLHLYGKPAEKRSLVENCISNRLAFGKTLDLKPYNWLQAVKTATSVPCGAPDRHTSRTSIDWGEVRRVLGRVAGTVERGDEK